MGGDKALWPATAAREPLAKLIWLTYSRTHPDRFNLWFLG